MIFGKLTSELLFTVLVLIYCSYADLNPWDDLGFYYSYALAVMYLTDASGLTLPSVLSRLRS